MKYYLHKEILKELRFPFGCLVIGIPWTIFGKLQFANCTFLIVGIITFGLVILKLWKYKNEKKYHKNTFERPALIEGSSIVFPSGYYFECSDLHETRRLESFEIVECCINTYPISFVTEEREIIFVPNIDEESIRKFCNADLIPISERIDIWERINRPFLDTEFEKHEIETNENVLSENGISKEEIKKIREKIAYTMIRNAFVWEWIYLGQFDYLCWTRLTKEKYWWSMEIALRNYKNNCA